MQSPYVSDVEKATRHINATSILQVKDIIYDEVNCNFLYTFSSIDIGNLCNYKRITIWEEPRIYNFECYMKNPDTGEGGWDIQCLDVRAHSAHEARGKLKTIPLFDCVILFNHCTPIQ